MIIWLDPDDDVYVLVDAEDYGWALQWAWHTIANQSKTKLYATRMTRHKNSRKQIRIFLHKEILIRKGDLPPSKEHTIGDHINGNSLDCRRHNLRWATSSMNNKNRKRKVTMAEPQDKDIPF